MKTDQENLKYAQDLARSIWEKHWKDRSPDFKPFDDLQGVLSQIDNMTAGMVRANLGKDVTAELLLAINRQGKAVVEMHKRFGPPGDYGYGSTQGKAILELYDSHNALLDAKEKIAPSV